MKALRERAERMIKYDDHNLLCGANPGLDDGPCGCVAKTVNMSGKLILAMADVMEAVQTFRDCKVSDEEAMLRTEDGLFKAHMAAQEKIKEIVG